MFGRKHKARVLAGITLSEITVPSPPPPPPEVSFWKKPFIWVTIFLLPIVYIVVCVVLIPYPGNTYTESTKVQVITAALGVLAVLTSYWLYSSYQSGKKDDTIAQSLPVGTVIPPPPAPPPVPVQIGTITNEGEKKS